MGIVISCKGCRDVYLPRDHTSGCRYIDPKLRHELDYDEIDGYEEYFLICHSLVVSYLLNGEEKIVEFKDTTVPYQYRAGDTVSLLYNKRTQAIQIKD